MTSTKTQKALVMPAAGGSYTVEETAVPQPGPDEVLVQIQAAGLNPVDWKLTLPEYAPMIPSYPFIPGSDGAGVVVQVGDSVTRFKVGNRVLFQGFRGIPSHAAFQQYALVPDQFAALIPENLSSEQAATVPATLGSVILALFNAEGSKQQESLGLKPFWEDGGKTAYLGKPVFIVGGASSLGQYAIQVAKQSGFGPIIATASKRNTELLTTLGATHVLDRTLSDEAILAEIPRLTSGKLLEYAFDTISLPETQSLAYKALPPGGSLVIVLPDTIPAEVKKEGDGKRIAFPRGVLRLPQNQATAIDIFKRLTQWLEQGVIKPNAYEVIDNGLAGIPAGLDRLRNNQVSAKKLVTHPQETP
ncbi:GroES-like protein [Trametes polyzona]|nr:GroES-like protein [Trametes polyzona]